LLRKTENARTLKSGGFDKKSTALVGAGFGIGLLLPLGLDAAGVLLFPVGILEGLGALLIMLLGLGLRIWAVVTLGRYYSRTLLVARDQKLVTWGPYSSIRHPGYLGSVLLWSGFAVLSSNLAIMILFPVMFVAIYLYRISVEERMLGQELGDDYARYRQRTRRILPFLY
jgi:protein-S-isoprenylcysteine O-methyltransferase